MYVLSGVYKLSRVDIDIALENFIDDAFVYEETVMRGALRMYAMSFLDFIDCWLIACNVFASEEVLTFDKSLLKHLR